MDAAHRHMAAADQAEMQVARASMYADQPHNSRCSRHALSAFRSIQVHGNRRELKDRTCP